MVRQCYWFVAAALLCVAFVAPGATQEKKLEGTKKTAALLQERVDLKGWPEEVKLKTVIEMLGEQLDKRGIPLSIFLDSNAFRAEAPDAPEIAYVEIYVKGLPKNSTVAQLLAAVLGGYRTRNATFVILPDRVVITTYSKASAEQKLQERVIASFDNQKLSQVLRELSEITGTTIVIDKRVGDKEDRPITASFLNDVSLAGALRVVTEMAELKVLVLEGAVYVTTPAQAEALRKEKMQLDEQLSPLWPMLPAYPPSLSGAAAPAPTAVRR